MDYVEVGALKTVPYIKENRSWMSLIQKRSGSEQQWQRKRSVRYSVSIGPDAHKKTIVVAVAR